LAVDQSNKGKIDDGNSLGTGNHNITAKKENGKNPIKSETKHIFLAKLKSVVWRTYETAQKDSNYRVAKLTGEKVFPEKNDPKEESYNCVVIDISIEETIPKGLKGKIFFKLLDPMNQCKTSNGERIGSTINDNGTCKMDYDNFEVDFTENSGTKKGIVLKINPAQPGANFIIVGHPRKETKEKIIIKTTDPNDKDLKTPIISGGNGNEQIIQTDLLTVWRTLWCELDQMEEPGYNIQDIAELDINDDSIIDYRDDRIERELYFADKDKGKKWDTTVPDNEAEKHATFDLHMQPPLPTIDFLTQQLKQACVSVEEYKNNELKKLPFLPNLSIVDVQSKKLVDFNWVNNSREYAKGHKQQNDKVIPYRSIPESDFGFWTIHIISTYEYNYEDHDNHDGFGSLGPFNNISNANGIFCKQFHGYNDLTAYIFYETIRDNTATHHKCKNVCPFKFTKNNIEYMYEVYASTELFFSRIVAHEVLHSFLGSHGNDTESIEPQSISDQTIMNYHLRYKDFDCNLNKKQLLHIQKLLYPKGSKD
jgi:hypothetical protein